MGRAYLPDGVNIAGTAHTTWLGVDAEDGPSSAGLFTASFVLIAVFMMFQ